MINGNPLPAFQSQMKSSVFGTRDLSHFEPEPGIQVGTRDQNRNPEPKLEPGTKIGTRNPNRNPEPKSEPGTRDPEPGTRNPEILERASKSIKNWNRAVVLPPLYLRVL